MDRQHSEVLHTSRRLAAPAHENQHMSSEYQGEGEGDGDGQSHSLPRGSPQRDRTSWGLVGPPHTCPPQELQQVLHCEYSSRLCMDQRNTAACAAAVVGAEQADTVVVDDDDVAHAADTDVAVAVVVAADGALVAAGDVASGDAAVGTEVWHMNGLYDLGLPHSRLELVADDVQQQQERTSETPQPPWRSPGLLSRPPCLAQCT